MRVELQAEVPGHRADLFGLVATSEGLRRWLDEAELGASVGAPFQVRMRDAVATGRILALDPPQHVSMSWQWQGGPVAGVVAFDLIDHGARTHITLRHVGLRTAAEVQLQAEVWRRWFGRLVDATRRQASPHEPGRPEPTAQPVE